MSKILVLVHISPIQNGLNHYKRTTEKHCTYNTNKVTSNPQATRDMGRDVRASVAFKVGLKKPKHSSKLENLTITWSQ